MGRTDLITKRATDICKSTLVLVLWLVLNPSWSQNLIDPITKSLTIFGQINSDYGPRNVSIGSNPHTGIDYQLTQGGKAYAVEGGQITKIYRSGSEAYIRIGPWRYIHMYVGNHPDQTWSVVQATPMISGSPYSIIFIREFQGGVLTTLKALTDAPVPSSVFDSMTGQYLTTTNTVNTGDLVFRSNGENHLHIDYSPGNIIGWENPFRYLAHANNANPTVLMWPERILGSQALTFPDSVCYGNPLIINAMMNVTQDKDFDEMRLSILPSSGIEKTLRHYDYEHHGLSGVPILVKPSSQQILAAPDSGIYPFKGVVSQDYFKYHFFSREDILGNEALCNLESSFPDGRYRFRAQGTDITGQTTTTETQVILDNFKPFVRGISISADHLLYGAWADYNPAADLLTWNLIPANHISSGLVNVNVSLQTSEPMREVSLDFQDPGILYALSSHAMHPTNAEKTEWAFTIPYIYVYQAIQNGKTGFQHLKIEGTDLAGSSLCQPNFPGSTTGTYFPHRLGDGSWSNNHKPIGDDNHGFYMGNGSVNNVLQAGLVGNLLSGPTPLQVNFADVSAGNPVEWEWNFGNGMTWSGQYPPTVTYTNYTSVPESYSVSLKVRDAGGNYSEDVRVNYITVFPDGNGNSSASFTFDQPDLGAPSLVSFTNTSGGNQVSYRWDFDDGSTSTAHSPMHLFSAPGYYDVQLRVTDNNGDHYYAEQTIYVYPSFSGAVNVDFEVMGQSIAGDFTRFNDLCSGGPSYARKLWDFGDGMLQEVIGIPIHLYYSPGIYQVRLEVRDYLDNLLGVKCKCITVLPDALSDLSTDINQLIAADPWWGDMLGRAVATDGEWAFVGAPYDDDKGNSSGSVYVYRLGVDSTWNFFQKILPLTGNVDDYFGSALACSGHRMVVGAPGNSNSSRGKVVFYAFDGQSWQENQSIPCPSLKHYHFGWSVSIDGNVACISAPNNSKPLPGAAWIFRESNGTWTMEAKLSDVSSTKNDGFGYDVALQGDHLIIALQHPAGPNQVWFWHYASGSWQVVSKRPVDKAYSVSIECPYAVCGDTWSNRLIIYAYNGTVWNVDGFVYPADGASGNDAFGSEVSLKGRYILAGKPGDGSLAVRGGSAYLFRRDDYGYWTQQRKLIPISPEADENFGWRVSLSTNHALVGAYGWKGYRGSGYVFNDVSQPCERERKWCDLTLTAGQKITDDCGWLQLAGDGCNLNLLPGSEAEWVCRYAVLKPGLTFHQGSQVHIRPIDCSLYYNPGTKSCSCSGATELVAQGTDLPDIRIFPNPSFAGFSLQWKGDVQVAQVELFDIQGRLILTWSDVPKEAILNVPALSEGLYAIKVILGNTSKTLRWIKRKV